jgi:hypothetical protein
LEKNYQENRYPKKRQAEEAAAAGPCGCSVNIDVAGAMTVAAGDGSGSGRDMYGMTAITRITPKMVAGTHGEGPASATASLDDDIAIITLDS